MKRTEAERLINNWLDTADEVTGATLIPFLVDVIGMHPPDSLRLATKNEIKRGISFTDQYLQEDVVWTQEWEPES